MTILRDLSINIRFQKELLSNITLYDEYDIKDGETPDIISERIYGTPLYHWAIMLMNDKFDYTNDWPLSSNQLQSYITDNYGWDNKDNIHHYIDSNGLQINSTDQYYAPPWTVNGTNHVVQCNLTAYSNIVTSVVSGAFSNLNDGSNLILEIFGDSIVPGTRVVEFIDNSTFAMTLSPNSGSGVSTITFRHIIDPLLGSTPVTNLEYETAVNETKRRIKLLHPSVLPQALDQLRNLING
jgi:hypothetical protein